MFRLFLRSSQERGSLAAIVRISWNLVRDFSLESVGYTRFKSRICSFLNLGSLRTASSLSRPSTWDISVAGIENLLHRSGSLPISRNLLLTLMQLFRSPWGRNLKISSTSWIGKTLRLGLKRELACPWVACLVLQVPLLFILNNSWN